jgi:hypothetical protein
MGLKATDHFRNSFPVSEFLIKLEKGRQTIRNSIISNTNFENDALDQI